MPTIYRVHRSSDGPTVGTDFPPELLSGRITDEGKPGQLMVGQYSALLVDGEMVPLRHPEEERELTALGETLETAQKKGILLQVDTCACLDCGVIYPRATRLVVRGIGPLGCALPMVAMAATIYGLTAYTHLNNFLTFFCGMIVGTSWLATHTYIVDKLEQRREVRVYPPLPARTCPYCHADNPRPIVNMLKKPVKISRQQTITVTIAGKS